MSFHLRLVRGESEATEMEQELEIARRQLALLSGARMNFQHSLNICREQSITTPQYNFWAFARENRHVFENLFQVAKGHPGLEEGLELVNLLMMLVYLRKVEQQAYRNAPMVAWSIFCQSNNADCQRSLLEEADRLAEQCTFPDDDAKIDNADLLKLQTKTNTFRTKVRKALG